MLRLPTRFDILDIEKKNEWRRPKRALRHFYCPENQGHVESGGDRIRQGQRQELTDKSVRPSRSVFDAMQSFFGGGVGVGQGEGGAEFLGCGCAVALFFQQLSEHGVGFECGGGFHRRFQVAAQQAHGQRIVAAGAEKHAGAVHERFGTVERARGQGGEGLFHLVKAAGVTKKDSEVEPGSSAPVAGVDGSAVLALCGSRVFGAFGEACGHPVPRRGIQAGNGFGLGTGFVFAAADDGGGFEMERGEIGAGGHV